VSRADLVVVGLGAMGSATTLALARRGRRVVALDQFHPPHQLGSSHGLSRIIREAYYESPAYVPLVQRAYRRWQEIERESGTTLLWRTGGLMIGPEDGSLVRDAARSAELHGIPVELLDGREIRRRFAVLAASDRCHGLLEPRAGILHPEACIEATLALARRAGAELRFGTRALGWERKGDALEVVTTAGRLTCGGLVVAAGPWLDRQLAQVSLPLVIERQVTVWFDTRELPAFQAARLPVFVWEWAPGRVFYGIPDQGQGLKAARHHEGEAVTADTVDRTVHEDDVAAVRALVRRYLPAADGPPLRGVVCLYTNAPDRHFILGPHPSEPRVILVSACSGHGFKFASAIGDVAADLAAEGATDLDLEPFLPHRVVPS
jgi:sarcosine oxidase